MAEIFSNARMVERPKVGEGLRGDQTFRKALPLVEQARDEKTAVALDTDDAEALRKALRKAGLYVSGEPVSVRISGPAEGKGTVTFWTTARITRGTPAEGD